MVLATLLKDLGISAVPYGFRPGLLSLGDLADLSLGAALGHAGAPSEVGGAGVRAQGVRGAAPGGRGGAGEWPGGGAVGPWIESVMPDATTLATCTQRRMDRDAASSAQSPPSLPVGDADSGRPRREHHDELAVLDPDPSSARPPGHRGDTETSLIGRRGPRHPRAPLSGR